MPDFHQRLYDIQEIFNGVLDVSRKRLKVILEGITDTTNNWLNVSLATNIAGEDLTNDVIKVEERFSFANILSATTTVVKSGAGFLHAITFNKPVASEVWTIYDNTAGSGTKIGTITLPGTLLSDGPKTAILDVAFSTGLTIVSSSTTDGTVSYR